MARLAKYHGLGNDFLIADLRGGDPIGIQEPAAVRALCDRRFGAGADGVLALLPAVTAGADARMRVLNADGSEAEMCGNGIRCVVKHLWEQDAALRRDALVIDTGAGPLRCAVAAPRGRVDGVTVDMGRPRLTRAEIPMVGPADERAVAVPLPLDGRELTITAVSMGNPHAITFVDDPAADLHALAERLGPSVEHHAWFPRRTNAEFARVHDAGEIHLVVWERGVGITMACGTGACATAVAACLTGRAQPGTDIRVHLPGGPLSIRVAADYATVHMTGPAAHVYDADLDVAAVIAAARPA
jgi:diaminopimelate epimerase